MQFQSISFQEGTFSVRTIETASEQLQAFQLRHAVYAEKLRWVPSSRSGLEVDEYDLMGISLGVFSDSGALVATLRLLPPNGPFMLERDFAQLLPFDYRIRKESDTMEVTRLTTLLGAENNKKWSNSTDIVLKGLYQWCITNEVRYLYFVVEKIFWRALLWKGFPCAPLGRTLSGVSPICVPLQLDWELFREINEKRRPAFLDWISNVAPGEPFTRPLREFPSKTEGRAYS